MVFVSPGTLATLTVTVVGTPAGGAWPSGMFTVAVVLDLVWAIVLVTAIALAPSP